MAAGISRYLSSVIIHNALTNDVGVLETEYVNCEVVNATWIHHRFEFETFQPFGFLDDFAINGPRPGVAARRRLQKCIANKRIDYLTKGCYYLWALHFDCGYSTLAELPHFWLVIGICLTRA